MSKVNVKPGAAVDYQAVNHFTTPEYAEFPKIGKTLLIPSGGSSVIARDGLVALVMFLPDGERIALVSGMTAEQAQAFGAGLIAAANAIGGDRGLQ